MRVLDKPCRYLLVVAGLAVALAVPALESTPAAAPATAREPAIAADAQAVLERMSAYLKGLERFSISARETRDEVLAYGYKLQRQQTATMVVQRPDRLRVEVAGDLKSRTYIYDGKTLVIVAPGQGVHAQVEAPPGLEPLLNGLLGLGVEMPLIDMLLQAVKGNLTEGVLGGRLVGTSRVDGVAVDHLAFRQATIDWQLWVEQGARPLPRKLAITTRYEVGEPQFTAVLDWNLQPDIDAGTFAFVPPPGSRRIELQRDAAGGRP
jgi:hypothetical protein